MPSFVVGFLLFNNNYVALIKKNRPAWQAGRYNGVGGHIEKGETPLQAMIREFKEETSTDVSNWRQFCKIKEDMEFVYCFVSRCYHRMPVLYSPTDEEVKWISIPNVAMVPTVEPLHWLLPMAASKQEIDAYVVYPPGSIAKKDEVRAAVEDKETV